MRQKHDYHATNPAPADDYQSYVEHPRYGRGPRLTGFNPSTNRPFDTHWHSPADERIPNTAIKADQSKQVNAAGAGSYGSSIRYYFDVRRVCRDCKRHFIFFAEEQKYWYEDLRFPLEVDCVRCHACRREQRGFEHARKRYNELVVLPSPNAAELIELVSISLDLIDGCVFYPHPRTFGRVRMWLNQLSGQPACADSRVELARRLKTLERVATQRFIDKLHQTDPPS